MCCDINQVMFGGENFVPPETLPVISPLDSVGGDWLAERYSEPEVSCSSCDDKGCGFCVTGDSLAAYFPRD